MFVFLFSKNLREFWPDFEGEKKMSIVAAAAAAAAASASRRAASAAAASASSQRAASSSALLNVASIEVPANVSVTRKGSELTVSGPLGTSRTDLASLDGRGDGALRLSADARSIEVASVSKPFFGTLQSLLKNKIEVRKRRRKKERETTNQNSISAVAAAAAARRLFFFSFSTPTSSFSPSLPISPTPSQPSK